MATTCILNDNSVPYKLKYVGSSAFRLVATVAGCSVVGLDSGGSLTDGDSEIKLMNHGEYAVTIIHDHSATEDVRRFYRDDETGLLTTELVEGASTPSLQRFLMMATGADLTMAPGSVYWAPYSEPDLGEAPLAPLGLLVDNQGQ